MKNSSIWVSVLAVIVTALWGIWNYLDFGSTLAESGQYGDKFGSLNALFTGLALIGLAVSFFREAKAKKEMADAIKAIEKQTKVQQEIFYIQAIASEIEGIEMLLVRDPQHIKPDDYRDRLRKLHHEFVLAKHRAAQALGIVAPD